MSTKAIRNKINNDISRIIADVKQKVIEEGKKRVMELKDKLLSPEYIIKMLTAEINQASCSPEGRDKFKEIADKLMKILNDMEEILMKGLAVFDGLKQKIGKISSKFELPPDTPNPIDGIKTITDAIQPLTKILNYVIMAAPAILSASSGPAANGAVIAKTNNGVNLAKVKIKEYVNLFRALPKVLDKYISMADQVYDKIDPIVNKLTYILGEIQRLKAFIIYLELDFIDKCNAYNLANYPVTTGTGNTVDPPIPIVHPTLEEITALINELYGTMLENLIAQGDHKALRRVYTLGAQFQREVNTQIKVVNYDPLTGDYI